MRVLRMLRGHIKENLCFDCGQRAISTFKVVILGKSYMVEISEGFPGNPVYF